MRLIVGNLVGFFVRLMVGNLVGLLVGILVGNLVGLLVGILVGSLVGLLVGLLVVFMVGNLVGFLVRWTRKPQKCYDLFPQTNDKNQGVNIMDLPPYFGQYHEPRVRPMPHQ